jgi:hypothetical protein
MPGTGRVRSLLAGEPDNRRKDVMARPMVWLRDFPWPGHSWVGALPAYNEHLVRDFGGMNLAMAVVFGVAAVTLDRRLAATVLVAFLVFALPHLVFHLDHLGPFGAIDAVAQVATLAVAAALPVPLLAPLHRARARPPRARSSSALTP